MSLAVREELAHVDSDEADERRTEAAALCRHAGSLHIRGPHGWEAAGPRWIVSTPLGAVARRLHRTLVEDIGIRPGIEVHQAGGLQRRSLYRLVLDLSAPDGAVAALSLVDGDRRPVATVPVLATPAQRRGWLRGAAMAGLSLSAPGQPAHLEIVAPDAAFAELLRESLRSLGAPSARAGVRSRRGGDTGPHEQYRVVLKSGEQVGAVLAALGAHHAFLDRDLRRLERNLRSAANRAANADRANLDRATRAAARQVAAVSLALDVVPADDVPEDVRSTALARMANPGASLGEIGALLDPPVGRATVHRRLRRLLTMAGEGSPGDGAEAS